MQQLFQELGFSDNEQKLYLILLEVGKAPANLLAKRTKIPRTTAYSVLQTLVQRGLVSEEKKEATTIFVANQPTALVRMIAEEKKRVQQRSHVAEELSRSLQPLFQSKGISVPKMQFFEGKAAIESMLYDYTTEWIDSAIKLDGTMWGYQDATFVPHYMSWLEYYWSLMKNTHIKLLSNIRGTEKGLKIKVPNREIRELKEKYEFSSSVWIVGEFIVVLQTRYTPHYAFQIKDRILSENLRFIYKILWQNSL